jgi:hypothetical protein
MRVHRIDGLGVNIMLCMYDDVDLDRCVLCGNSSGSVHIFTADLVV